MAQLWQTDPESAQAMLKAIQGMKKSDLEKQKQMSEAGGQLALAVLQAPPDQQPSLYLQAVQAAKAQGLDVSRLPPQWGPEAENALRLVFGQSLAVKEMVEAYQKQATDMTPAQLKAANLREGTVAQRKGTGEIDVVQKPKGEAGAAGGKLPAAMVQEVEWIKNNLGVSAEEALTLQKQGSASPLNAMARVWALVYSRAIEGEDYGNPTKAAAKADAAGKQFYNNVESLRTGKGKKAGAAAMTKKAKTLAQAQKAIDNGKDPAAVRKKLQEMGIDPKELDKQ